MKVLFVSRLKAIIGISPIIEKQGNSIEDKVDLSFVTKNVPAGTVFAGLPAKKNNTVEEMIR